MKNVTVKPEPAMKKIFSNFLLSYISLTAALLVILLVVSIYIYDLSKNVSNNEGYSHLSNQMEILNNDLTRTSSLINFAGNYNSIIRLASLDTPVSSGDFYVVNQARQDLAGAVNALVTDMIVEYGIVFQNGLCITANRFFNSVTDCFGVNLRFPVDNTGLWTPPESFTLPGYYYIPKNRDFAGIIYSGLMQLREFPYQSNIVFFVIDTAVLLGKWLNNDIAYVELYNKNTLIASYGNFEPRVKYQKIEYSGSGNHRGIAYIPNSVIWRKIRPVSIFIFMSIVFFIITGLGLSLYFSQKHARPIQKITSQLMHQTRITSLPANELLFIIHSVEQMGTDLEKTQDILREQDRMLRLGMFERLLGGIVYTRTEWDQARSMFGDFPEVWCLCLIRGNYEGNEIPEFVRSGVHLSAQFVCERLNTRSIVHYIENDGAVIILPVNEDRPEPENYSEILNETAELMRTKHQLNISVAVSGVFGSIESLSAAYRQTRQLLRMAGGQTGKSLFFMGDEDTNLNQFPLEFSDSQRFYELLLAADFEHTALMIKNSFNYFQDRGFIPESAVYHLFWSFEQVFIRIRAENAKNKDFDFALPVYNPQDSIEELAEKLLSAASSICGNIEKSSRRREMELSAAIITYVEENISNPMLNLSEVATAFHLSERYTQAKIRKTAGKSFFEYVDQKRMKMAYSLLTESAISVNDIGIKCGFALPNSFYKAFKRHFGFPPTELRKTQ